MGTVENIKEKRISKTGKVISNKMDKTISVAVDRLVYHPIVKKIIKRRSKCLVHDEKNDADIGDTVLISDSRPLSKKKRWVLETVIKRKLESLK